MPDRIILLPCGLVIFVETKRPRGGVLSSRQKWWMKELQRLGFPYYTIWNQQDLEAFAAAEL